MPTDRKIKNAFKRSEEHRKAKREKEQIKLKRRMEIRKAEKSKDGGAELKKERLAKNVPRTIDNTRIYDSSSYLTADPASLRAAADKAAEASRALNAEGSGDEDDDDNEEDDDMEGSDDEEEDDEDENENEQPQAGPSRLRTQPAPVAGTLSAPSGDEPTNGISGQAEGDSETATAPLAPLASGPPPRIMITTSPSPCKETYAFCEDLRGIFPGGEFFKRPRGKGFEIGRVARWAAKRGYNAICVVNEDHKIANAITIMALPAGPTAYFKLTSVLLSRSIYGHARPTPHSPELILNNFTTLLGHSVGRLFGALFPPQPQFRGRQVVTLHNQRDFLFFRRHRYVFNSPTKASLQEIGPRFTLKLRWLRKGLPAVTAADGRIPGGARGDGEEDETAAAGAGADEDEQMDEDEAMREIGTKPAGAQQNGKKATPTATATREELGIPALDDEQEYEWKWKPKMEVSRRTFFL